MRFKVCSSIWQFLPTCTLSALFVLPYVCVRVSFVLCPIIPVVVCVMSWLLFSDVLTTKCGLPIKVCRRGYGLEIVAPV